MVATAFFEYSKLAIGQQPFNLFNYIENRTPKDGLPSGCLSLCLRQVEFFRTLSKRPLTSPCLANEKPGPGGSDGVTFGLIDMMLV